MTSEQVKDGTGGENFSQCPSFSANRPQQIPPGCYPQNLWFPFAPGQQMPWVNFVAAPQAYPSPSHACPPEVASMSAPSPENNAYMFDALKRIYSDTDGSIEIERVKFLRKQALSQESHHPVGYPGFQPTHPGVNTSLVPFAPFQLNERRPPPRKHKKNLELAKIPPGMPQTPSHPWYPYSPYMPYPYPHPFCYGYMWGAPPPPAEAMGGWVAGSEVTGESERTSSVQESFPEKPDSQFLESKSSQLSRSSISPEFQMSLTTPPGSNINEFPDTDIAPSDSVSVRGGKQQGFSTRKIHRGSAPPQTSGKLPHKDKISGKSSVRSSDKPSSSSRTTDVTQDDTEKSSFTTAPSPSDIPVVPTRRNKSAKLKRKREEEIAAGKGDGSSTVDEIQSNPSDLSYAFKKFEKSVHEFESQVSCNSSFSNDLNSLGVEEGDQLVPETEMFIKTIKDQSSTGAVPKTKPMSNVPAIGGTLVGGEGIFKSDLNRNAASGINLNQTTTGFARDDATGGRESRSTLITLNSKMTTTDDQFCLDTDSMEIILPTDGTTADEGAEQTDATTVPGSTVDEGPADGEEEENYRWLLQRPGGAPFLAPRPSFPLPGSEEDRSNAWRAEVSLWRARLVVSLCRGCGLDQQDWATFQLLVLHPLTLDMKLSLLHAHRFCTANSSLGAEVLRAALLHLTRYGEILLQPERQRPQGWRTIKVDSTQPWAPVKGSIEILRVLGYKAREDGLLRYPRRAIPETSVLARLTLDMLVLAEELRHFISGTHQHPTNVSSLFCVPAALPSDVPHSGPLQSRPASSTSGGFISAQSTPPAERQPRKQESSGSEEDTTTIKMSTNLVRQKTLENINKVVTCEEVKTVFEDTSIKGAEQHEQAHISEKNKQEEVLLNESVKTQEAQTPSPIEIRPESTDVSSVGLPDLESIGSRSVSRQTDPPKSDLQGSPPETPTSPEDITNKMAGEEDKKEPSKSQGDNPEEHVYEEIGDIRSQVQALRAASEPVLSPPPPLPPKTRINSGGDDDSSMSVTYPNVDWSSKSKAESVSGGSTGARKKKRRAPMPPSFMSPTWKTDKSASEARLIRAEEKRDIFPSAKDFVKKYYKKTFYTKKSKEEPALHITFNKDKPINPFYEEIKTPANANEGVECSPKSPTIAEDKPVSLDKSVGSEKPENPFSSEKFVPRGFVGKNPFYEDLPSKSKTTATTDSQNQNQSKENATDVSKQELKDLVLESAEVMDQRKVDEVKTAELCLSEDIKQDNLRVEEVMPATRSKRRAPKPPEELVTTTEHAAECLQPSPIANIVSQEEAEHQNPELDEETKQCNQSEVNNKVIEETGCMNEASALKIQLEVVQSEDTEIINNTTIKVVPDGKNDASTSGGPVTDLPGDKPLYGKDYAGNAEAESIKVENRKTEHDASEYKETELQVTSNAKIVDLEADTTRTDSEETHVIATGNDEEASVPKEASVSDSITTEKSTDECSAVEKFTEEVNTSGSAQAVDIKGEDKDGSEDKKQEEDYESNPTTELNTVDVQNSEEKDEETSDKDREHKPLSKNGGREQQIGSQDAVSPKESHESYLVESFEQKCTPKVGTSKDEIFSKETATVQSSSDKDNSSDLNILSQKVSSADVLPGPPSQESKVIRGAEDLAAEIQTIRAGVTESEEQKTTGQKKVLADSESKSAAFAEAGSEKLNDNKRQVRQEQTAADNDRYEEINVSPLPALCDTVKDETPAEVPSPESPPSSTPPLLPPKAPLRLLDDIPYIDVNDAKYYQIRVTPSKSSTAPRYEIPDYTVGSGSSTFPPSSSSKLRQPFHFMHSCTTVPFIDESDLPPDFPPPPPPSESPSTTPANSPPETPHVSPPETPHASPPETPHHSPPPSPVSETPYPMTGLELDLRDKPAVQVTIRDSVSQCTTKERTEIPTDAIPLNTNKSKTPRPVSEERYEIPEPPKSEVQVLTLKTGALMVEKKEAPCPSPSLSSSRPQQTEDPDNQKMNSFIEEGYEIPDVAKAEAFASLSKGRKETLLASRTPSQQSECRDTSESEENSVVEGNPKRPPRKRKNPSPPPRPPKALNAEVAPPLPPKGIRTPNLRLSSSLSSIDASQASKVPESEASKTRPALCHPSPSQAKKQPSLTKDYIGQKDNPKKRFSWPFIFCECIYANCRNYDKVH